MDEIELVVKIPKEILKDIKMLSDYGYNSMFNGLVEAVNNGTPLPKGHGRIGDLDALRCENADFDTYNDYCTMFEEIEAAETIIKADKAGK